MECPCDVPWARSWIKVQYVRDTRVMLEKLELDAKGSHHPVGPTGSNMNCQFRHRYSRGKKNQTVIFLGWCSVDLFRLSPLSHVSLFLGVAD